MTTADDLVGGHYYTSATVPVSMAMQESAVRSASHTGNVQVIHIHSVDEPCQSIDYDGRQPGAGQCFWVWPDLQWAGGIAGLDPVSRKEMLDGAAIRAQS